MQIYNNTPNDVGYDIGNPSNADCGTIEAGGTSVLSDVWDNADNVTLSIFALGTTPFTASIPLSSEDMTVTIGIYQE